MRGTEAITSVTEESSELRAGVRKGKARKVNKRLQGAVSRSEEGPTTDESEGR